MLASRSTSGHLGYLDGLRGLAAMFVVVHHILQLAEQRGRFEGLLHPVTRFLNYGHFAVSVFIVVSGFCLMLPVVRGGGPLRIDARVFFLKRARRILPPYYLAIPVALLVPLLPSPIDQHPGSAVSLVNYWQSTSLLDVVTHLGLVHNLYKPAYDQINPVFWSIAVEWQIYFGFPLLLWAWRRFGGPLTTLASVLVGYLMLIVVRNSLLDGLTPHYFGLFAMGMLASAIAFSPSGYLAVARERVNWQRLTAGLATATIAACLVVQVVPLRTMDGPVGLAAASLLIAVAHRNGAKLRGVFGWKPLVALGTFAYSIYLIHIPVLWLLVRSPIGAAFDQSANQRFYAMLVMGVPLSVLGGYVFYLGCERPFVRWAGSVRPAPPVLAPQAPIT